MFRSFTVVFLFVFYIFQFCDERNFQLKKQVKFVWIAALCVRMVPHSHNFVFSQKTGDQKDMGQAL